MKTIKILEEQHDKLRSISFFSKMTIQEIVSSAIDEYVEKCKSSKVEECKSSKVENTTNTLDHLDWTDKEAQNLIDPSIMKKFNL
jgi:hypothetical protein